MTDAGKVMRCFPELRPLAEQQAPPWTFYTNHLSMTPTTVTCARCYFVDGAWYADAIHVGVDAVGATRCRWPSPGSTVESLWTFAGEVSEAVARVLKRPDTGTM
jgi:hypothetical protein